MYSGSQTRLVREDLSVESPCPHKDLSETLASKLCSLTSASGCELTAVTRLSRSEQDPSLIGAAQSHGWLVYGTYSEVHSPWVSRKSLLLWSQCSTVSLGNTQLQTSAMTLLQRAELHLEENTYATGASDNIPIIHAQGLQGKLQTSDTIQLTEHWQA